VLTLEFSGEFHFDPYTYVHCNFYFIIIVIYIIINFLRLCPYDLLVWISRCFGLCIVVVAGLHLNELSISKGLATIDKFFSNVKNFLCWHNIMETSNYENNQKDALYKLIYYSKSAVHVLGDVFAHHQEHLTVFTVSGSVHPSCCRLVSGMSWNGALMMGENIARNV